MKKKTVIINGSQGYPRGYSEEIENRRLRRALELITETSGDKLSVDIAKEALKNNEKEN